MSDVFHQGTLTITDNDAKIHKNEPNNSLVKGINSNEETFDSSSFQNSNPKVKQNKKLPFGQVPHFSTEINELQLEKKI